MPNSPNLGSYIACLKMGSFDCDYIAQVPDPDEMTRIFVSPKGYGIH
jgi:hypothetical protein